MHPVCGWDQKKKSKAMSKKILHINMHSDFCQEMTVIKWRADNYWLCIKNAWNFSLALSLPDTQMKMIMWTKNGTMYNMQYMYAVVLCVMTGSAYPYDDPALVNEHLWQSCLLFFFMQIHFVRSFTIIENLILRLCLFPCR